jgi:hypothetical protein
METTTASTTSIPKMTGLNFKPRDRRCCSACMSKTQLVVYISMAIAFQILLSVCIILLADAGFFQGKSYRPDFSKVPIVGEAMKPKTTAQEVGDVVCRLPRAIGRSIKLSAKSFVTSSAILFPVGLVMNINQMKPIDAWLMKGATTSIEWAKIGACFAVRILRCDE